MMISSRLSALPKYLFASIDEAVSELREKGVDVIDFGVGDPDLPTPPHIVEEMIKAVQNPAYHHYPSYVGMPSFREAVAKWYKKVFGVHLDPEREVIALIGSKEGIAHTPLAFLDPGDISIVPDPSYPVYKNSTILADGVPYSIPLFEDNEFLPEMEKIPRDVREKAKLLFLNYPNNPTTAVADKQFLREVVEFAYEWDILICYDNPYSEIVFDGYKAPSILQVRGAKEIGIEFHSLSKTYNMTGWRIGFAVGCEKTINALGMVKTNIDSGVFEAVQRAGIKALLGPQDCVRENIRVYRERREEMLKLVETLGLEAHIPKATFYVWAKIKDGTSSIDYCKRLLEKYGIVATPGVGFGEYGEGYLRFALTRPLSRIEEAIKRIS
jgi:LL-diaminopimelate aminotransferase